MKAEHIASLVKTPLFSGIGKEDLVSFLICLNPRIQEYAKGEVIALEGDAMGGIGVMLSGEVAVLKETSSGDRMILTVLKPGSLFGEMAAWSAEHRWPATVQAQEASAVLFIPPEKITSPCQKACRWHPAIIQNMLKILSEKALMLNRKVDYLAMKSMRGKLCAYLLERQKLSDSLTFTLPLNRNEMADYLSVSRPSMSREMGRMRDEGLIDFHMSTMKIKNMPAVRAAAE